MSPTTNIGAEAIAPKPRRAPLPARILRQVEDGALVVSLAVMVLLPLIEIVLRKTLRTGISGSTSFVQHGSLVVGMIGGAVAARQDRLLSLATAQLLPKGWPARTARIFASSVAAAVTVLLLVGSIQFVGDEFKSGQVIAYGLRAWVLQLVMPIGLALIAGRLLRHAGERWLDRAVAAAVAGGLLLVFALDREPSGTVIWVGLGLIVVATVLGAPVYALLGGAAVVFFWGDESPLRSLSIDHYSLVTNPSLPAIPLFTLAGYLLAEGGASRRLVEVFSALFGRVRGGPAIVTVLVCAFFTTFTGASGVTILALGGLLLPILLSQGYSQRNALGLVTGAGSLGMLFPPCLPLILYAIIAAQPVDQLFLAGIAPGAVLVLVSIALGVWLGPRRDPAGPPLSLGQAGTAVWRAKWELLLPVVAMVALFGGFATPVEASAVTALYALVTQTFVTRDLKLTRDVPRVWVECGLVVGGVLLILGLAKGFTNYLVFAQVPDALIDWVGASIHSRWTFLLLLNLALLVVGCLMDVYSAIIVVVPLLAPLGVHFGIDPLHLGIIFLANLELGFLTPPVGMNLFLASYRFNKPLGTVCRSILPLLAVQFLGVLVITYVPPLSTALPNLHVPPPIAAPLPPPGGSTE